MYKCLSYVSQMKRWDVPVYFHVHLKKSCDWIALWLCRWVEFSDTCFCLQTVSHAFFPSGTDCSTTPGFSASLHPPIHPSAQQKCQGNRTKQHLLLPMSNHSLDIEEETEVKHSPKATQLPVARFALEQRQMGMLLASRQGKSTFMEDSRMQGWHWKVTPPRSQYWPALASGVMAAIAWRSQPSCGKAQIEGCPVDEPASHSTSVFFQQIPCWPKPLSQLQGLDGKVQCVMVMTLFPALHEDSGPHDLWI